MYDSILSGQMNLDFAKQILQSITQQPDGFLTLRERHMLREARQMQSAGWLQLTKLPGEKSAVLASLTDAGSRISRLFQPDAIAQRFSAAFMPRGSAEAL